MRLSGSSQEVSSKFTEPKVTSWRHQLQRSHGIKVCIHQHSCRQPCLHEDLGQGHSWSPLPNGHPRPRVVPIAGTLGQTLGAWLLLQPCVLLIRIELLQTTMVWLTFTVVPPFLFASDLLALRAERALGDHLWPTSHSLINSLQSQVAVGPQLAQHQGPELSPDQQTTPLAEGSFHMGGGTWWSLSWLQLLKVH